MIASLSKVALTWLFLHSVFVDKSCSQDMEGGTVVQVSQGKLMGLKLKSVYQRTPYYSFQGIPFAEPPVGELRFMVGRQIFTVVSIVIAS